MKPLLALLAAAAALVALAWAWLTRPTAVAHVTVDPDDDMAGVQVDVRLKEYVVHPSLHQWLTPPQYGTGDYWPQPWVNTNSTQTGPLGPTA